jgi:hypothetical protein
VVSAGRRGGGDGSLQPRDRRSHDQGDAGVPESTGPDERLQGPVPGGSGVALSVAQAVTSVVRRPSSSDAVTGGDGEMERASMTHPMPAATKHPEENQGTT